MKHGLHSPQWCHLLSLPPEIRNIIYTYVLYVPTPSGRVTLTKSRTAIRLPSALSILQTCYQIKNEAECIFYHINHLRFPAEACASEPIWLFSNFPQLERIPRSSIDRLPQKFRYAVRSLTVTLLDPLSDHGQYLAKFVRCFPFVEKLCIEVEPEFAWWILTRRQHWFLLGLQRETGALEELRDVRLTLSKNERKPVLGILRLCKLSHEIKGLDALLRDGLIEIGVIRTDAQRRRRSGVSSKHGRATVTRSPPPWYEYC